MAEHHLVGINEAARLTGKNKGTINQHVKSGKLSAVLSESGERKFQVAELERVYGKLRDPSTGYAPLEDNRSEPVSAPATTTSATPEIVKVKDEIIALLKEQLADAQQQRDHWREQANRALPAPAAATPAPTTAPVVEEPAPVLNAPVAPDPAPPKKRGLFGLFGRKATT